MDKQANLTVNRAVFNSVDWGVNKTVRLIIDWDVNDAVDNALYRTVPWVVRDVMHWAVGRAVEEDPACSGLQDFLFEVEVEV